MTGDIVQYWSRLKDHDTTHPDDRVVFDRLDGAHGFDLRCLPSCFFGPIATAPVVVLYLSPGLKEDIDHRQAASPEGRAWYRETRAGRALLPHEHENEAGWRWGVTRTGCFGKPKDVQPHIALLNLSGYHSRTFADWPLLSALPSCRATLSWAHNVLFPDAIAEKRIVICLRSPRYWGLYSGFSEGSLYAPEATRSGHMIKSALRDEIIEKVKRSIKRAQLAR